jgi:hypothetical protein
VGALAAGTALGEFLSTEEGMAMLATLVHAPCFHLKVLTVLATHVARLPRDRAGQALAIIAERMREASPPPALEPLDVLLVGRFIETIEGSMTDEATAPWMEDLIAIGEGGCGSLELLEKLRNTVGNLHRYRRVIDGWSAYRYARRLETLARQRDRGEGGLTPGADRFTAYAQELATALRLEGQGSAPSVRSSGKLRRIK